jgi:ABC-type Fe3+/spermidine/putrescine transport system ATPase subunit
MLADRIAVIDAGRVVQFGPPEDVFHRPGSAFVAGFMGADNALPMVRLPDGSLMLSRDAGGEPVTAHFRSDAARVGAAGGAAGDPRASLRGQHRAGGVRRARLPLSRARDRRRRCVGACRRTIDEGTPVNRGRPA